MERDITKGDGAQKAEREGRPSAFRVRPSVLRGMTAALVFVLVGVGLSIPLGTGSLSALGVGSVSAICPLGALETLLGTWAFVPRLVIAAIGMMLVVFVAGKAFCSFLCPVPYIRNLFRTKRRKEADAAARHAAAQVALDRYQAGEAVERKALTFDGRYLVLAAALFSAAVFGFPVFCLACPVGLSIATFVAVWQLVQTNTLTIGLVLFPLIVFLEVVVFSKWCKNLCPMGALFSLVSSKSRFFRLSVDPSVCVRDTRGKACAVCASVCDRHIDPHSDLGLESMIECDKCSKCVEHCPVRALSFSLLPKARQERKRESA